MVVKCIHNYPITRRKKTWTTQALSIRKKQIRQHEKYERLQVYLPELNGNLLIQLDRSIIFEL